MVLLDVVYNHFGPEGNYLHAYCAAVLQRRRTRRRGARRSTSTASERAPCATSSSTTRSTGSRNSTSTACAWTRSTPSPTTRRRDIVRRDRARACATGPGRERHVHLVLENDATRPRCSARDARGAPRAPTAQWNDDLHHALHVLLTGETRRLLRATTPTDPRRHLGPRARRGLRLPGRGVGVPRRRGARRAERAPAAGRLRLVPAEPRPGRQPRVGRAHRHARATARAARCATACAAARAARAAAVHGRGVRGLHAVPLLLRFRPASSPTRCARAGAREFAALRALRRPAARAAHPRPERRGDLLRIEAPLERTRRGAARAAKSTGRRAARAAPAPSRRSPVGDDAAATTAPGARCCVCAGLSVTARAGTCGPTSALRRSRSMG